MRTLTMIVVLLVFVVVAGWQIGTPEGRDTYCKLKLNTDPFLCDGKPFTTE